MYSGNISVAANYINSNPTTYDFLKPNGFRFAIKEIPQASYTCQKVMFPSLTFGAAIHHTPRLDYSLPGEKVTFGDLSISFIISEDMQNYKEIHKWMLGMGDHTGGDYFQELYEKRRQKATSSIDTTNNFRIQYSDATLIVLNSANNPVVTILFKDVFPVSLSAIPFDSTVQSIMFQTCECVFKYATFEILE
jgi:hypothetical protein